MLLHLGSFITLGLLHDVSFPVHPPELRQGPLASFSTLKQVNRSREQVRKGLKPHCLFIGYFIAVIVIVRSLLAELSGQSTSRLTCNRKQTT